MNYVITVEKSQTVTIENPFAKEDKKVEKTFSTMVMSFNIISDKAMTAAELIAQASEKADKQIRMDIAERKLYSRSLVKGEEVKKFYADSDVVEETSLRYSAEVKTA